MLCVVQGIPGNDDFGTLSAWAVFAMLGFYPQAGSDVYILGSPVFAKAVVHRSDGDIVIIAHNASADNVYAHNISVNGVPVRLPGQGFVLHEQLVRGNTYHSCPFALMYSPVCIYSPIALMALKPHGSMIL